MFPAWLVAFGKTAAAAVLNTASGLQAIQYGSGSGSVTIPGALIGSGFSKSSTTGSGASLSLYNDGTAYTADDGTWEWWIPATANKGVSYWAELVATGGTGTMSGSPLSTRIRIDSAPSWELVTLTRVRTFTLNFYDAASGGSLVTTGSITLENA